MNSTTVYNGEKHDRWTRWYVLFALIVGILVVFSLLYGNYSWVVLLFFLVGWYFFYQILHLQEIQLVVQNDGIHVDKIFYPWSDLQWFSLELDKTSWLARNIVLVKPWSHHIYSFAGDLESAKEVVFLIDEQLPLLDVYPQTFAQRLVRTLKL